MSLNVENGTDVTDAVSVELTGFYPLVLPRGLTLLTCDRGFIRVEDLDVRWDALRVNMNSLLTPANWGQLESSSSTVIDRYLCIPILNVTEQTDSTVSIHPSLTNLVQGLDDDPTVEDSCFCLVLESPGCSTAQFNVTVSLAPN